MRLSLRYSSVCVRACVRASVRVRMSKQDRALPLQSSLKFCRGANLTGERVRASIFYSHKLMNHVLVTEERTKDKKTQQKKSLNEERQEVATTS